MVNYLQKRDPKCCCEDMRKSFLKVNKKMPEVSQKFIQTIEKLNSTNYAKYLKSSGTLFS